MEIIKMVESKMGQNTYLVVDEKDAIIIDCGVGVDVIEENLRVYSHKPKVRGVFLTHSHFDHIRELDAILDKYECPAYIAKEGKKMLYDADKNLSIMESPFVIKEKKGINTFKDLDTITMGDNISIKCYLTPGHSIDSACFAIGGNLFTGDTLFKIDSGRTDLYSGDNNMLKISLERILNELSVDIDNFYPGHGANFDGSDMKYNIERLTGDM